jgi:hypothetical protein
MTMAIRVARARSGRGKAPTGLLLRLRRAHRLTLTSLHTFVVAFIALPCAHNFNHRDDHDHGVPGETSTAGDHGHTHAPVASAGWVAPAPASTTGGSSATTGDQVAPTPGGPGSHGHGSAAHFGVGILAPPFFVVPPPAAAPITTRLFAAWFGQPPQPFRQFCRPRGPPVG